MRPDYYLWSLQKDFAIPAIGSVMIVSDRALQAARRTTRRGVRAGPDRVAIPRRNRANAGDGFRSHDTLL